MKTLGAESQTPVAANSVADCLRAARKLIEDPWTWGKGWNTHPPMPPRFCALTAISALEPGAFISSKSTHLLRAAIKNGSIGEWNDAPERTHAEVLAAFDRAIVLAEQEGA